MLEPASFALAIAAVLGLLAVEGALVLAFKEGSTDPDIYVSPGEQLIQRALAVVIEGGVEPAVLKGGEPFSIIEALAPGIEGAAELPGAVDDLRQAAVASSEHPLEETHSCILP